MGSAQTKRFNSLYALINDSGAERGHRRGEPALRYPIDQIELWLYVGKFAAGKTGEHERRIREWAAMQIVGAGPIRAFGLQDIVATARRVASTLRAELLDRTLIWNHTHLRHALREYERHYDEHRTHRSLAAAAPLRDRPQHLRPGQIEHLNVERQDRLGGVIHEYRHAAEPARV